MVAFIQQEIKMSFDYYMDIHLINSADTMDLSLATIRNQVYTVLHGAFRSLDDSFALALVSSKKLKNKQAQHGKRIEYATYFDFDIFRIFSQNEQALDKLINAISQHWKIRDYTTMSSPRRVPIAKITGWNSYRRFRIPTAKMERTNLSDNNKPLRERRLEAARGKPFLKVNSKSTGQKFTVIVDIVPMEDAGQGLPDGYGLARKSQPFALPIFDVSVA